MTKVGLDVEFMEGENKALPYTMSYGSDWSVSGVRGTPIPKSALWAGSGGAIFFYVQKFADATAILEYSDALGSIMWLNSPYTDGNIQINFAAETIGKAQRGLRYELRVRWADGSYTSLEIGALHITESPVARP